MANEKPTATEEAQTEKPIITVEELAKRLHRAVVSEDDPAPANNFRDLANRLALTDVGALAADFIYLVGLVSKDEYPAAKALFKSKSQEFKEKEIELTQRNIERKAKEPQWTAPRPPTYLGFVGGSLLKNFNEASKAAADFAGEEILDWSLLAVTNFLGHVVAENGDSIRLSSATESEASLPVLG